MPRHEWAISSRFTKCPNKPYYLFTISFNINFMWRDTPSSLFSTKPLLSPPKKFATTELKQYTFVELAACVHWFSSALSYLRAKLGEHETIKRIYIYKARYGCIFKKSLCDVWKYSLLTNAFLFSPSRLKEKKLRWKEGIKYSKCVGLQD